MLLLASHKNLIWYDVENDRSRVLNDEHRIYYGMFPGESKRNSVWVISSKLDTRRMQAKQDQMLEIEKFSGKVLKIVSLPSGFTHDAVRSPDGSKVFVSDTARGAVHIYKFPDLKHEKTITAFKPTDHINTFSPTNNGTLWVVLLNRVGKSFISLVDIETEQRICTLREVGEDVHGLIQMEDNSFLMLSSSETALIKIRVPKYCPPNRALKADRTILWQYKQSLIQKKIDPKFLKGLAVLDNVAYFGMSEYEGSREGRMLSVCSLLAFDLRLGTLLWIRTNVGTKGLLNMIGTPQISITSTYKPQKTVATEPTETSPCAENYLTLLEDSQHFGPAFGMPGPGIFFIELPLQFDLKRLRKETDHLVKTFGWTFRADVNNYFILLVTKLGVATDQSNIGPFHPVPGRLQTVPYIRQVFAAFKSIVGRSRFMLLKAGETITRHFDITSHIIKDRPSAQGGYWGRRFRVHIPIITDQTIIFSADDPSGSAKIHMKAGRAYLFDNSVFHSVVNPSKVDRIHLIFDTIGSVELYKLILDSQVVVANSVFTPFPDASETRFVGSPKSEAPVEKTYSVPWVKENEDLQLVYENWTDSGVFFPMHPKFVEGYFSGYVKELLLDQTHDSYEQVNGLLSQFLADWSNTCYVPWYNLRTTTREVTKAVRITELVCKDMAFDLLKDVLELDICSSTTSAIPLRKKLSMSLTNIVESFIRMLFYECKGWGHYDIFYVRGPPCDIKRNIFLDEIRGFLA